MTSEKTSLTLVTTLQVLLAPAWYRSSQHKTPHPPRPKMQPTLELSQHFSHPRDATHCLQLQGDGLQFQPCNTLTSGKSTQPTVLNIHQPPQPLQTHPLLHKVHIPTQDSSHPLEVEKIYKHVWVWCQNCFWQTGD